jgi:galactonate dehydratase
MKITDIKCFVVDCYRTNWVFVKMFTDEGLYGVGEGTLEYKEHALVGAIEDLKRYLIGKDPRQIEFHVMTMYRDAYWRGGAVLMSAVSAVEMCMWDILGKSLGVPVSTMLGGQVRDRVPLYANGWFSGAKTPEEFGKMARHTVSLGVKALKWDPFGKAYMEITNSELDQALACIAAVRQAVGNEVDILIEGHGRFNIASALTIAKELEQFKPLWFEEPIPPDNIDALAEVRSKSPVRIAGGERLYSKYDFRVLFEKRAVDYIQPDVSHAGGLLELKKISAMAESYYVSFAPHNPSGPIATAATLQLAACSPNFKLLEIMITDVPWRKDITDEHLMYEDGCIKIPLKPGLGIDFDESVALEHPYRPVDLRHYRGDLTEIRPENSIYYFIDK